MITGLTQWILGIPGAPEFCASALPLVGGLGLLIALSVCLIWAYRRNTSRR